MNVVFSENSLRTGFGMFHARTIACLSYHRFNLPYATQPLGLPLGQHISLKATAEDGSEVIKPYTPVSDLGVRGYVEFVIKVSPSLIQLCSSRMLLKLNSSNKCALMQVYPQGRMSQAMDKLKIGDKLLFKGPKGRFSLDENEKRAVGMQLDILKPASISRLVCHEIFLLQY